ncbi:MAG TPA: SGNH/GDSL hydrolase family protein, partial [Pirellulaceae bacterium]|nr:SGNH/GDSL hydrolase family protein [Pirellulaceae bacterium]
AMPHMPATGVSGLDLYVKLGDGKWHWLANGRPSAQTNTAVLARELGGESREYLVYLPLYNGVSSLEIGVPAGAKLEPAAARAAKPVVVWGTSITQGGCASRPGMVHTAILARRLERDVINLGFSGNGKMEPEMARFIAEIDAAAYLIDCLPNMTAAEVTERVENVVKILREKRPNAAIILAEDRTYSDAYLIKSKRERNESSRKALREAFARMQESKIPNVIYLPGEGQLGADEEGTVDSSHPTDLGFLRMADFFEPYLVKAIKLSTP